MMQVETEVMELLKSLIHGPCAGVPHIEFIRYCEREAKRIRNLIEKSPTTDFNLDVTIEATLPADAGIKINLPYNLIMSLAAMAFEAETQNDPPISNWQELIADGGHFSLFDGEDSELWRICPECGWEVLDFEPCNCVKVQEMIQ